MIWSSPEPACDIAAQIDYIAEPGNPKDTVFVVKGNEDALPAEIPLRLAVINREEGTIITRNTEKLKRLSDRRELGDDEMAALLGYPASKLGLIWKPNLAALQIRNADDCVVCEAIVERDGNYLTRFVESSPVPEGGYVVMLSPEEALERRRVLRGAQRQGLL